MTWPLSILRSARVWLIIGVCVAGAALAYVIQLPETEQGSLREETLQPSTALATPRPERALPRRAPFSTHRAIIERPLLHPQRRALPERPPPAPPPVAEPPPPEPPAGYKLRGAVLGSGHKVAVLENMATTEYIRIGEGETVGGWTLARIDGRSVTFEFRDQSFVLELALPDREP